MEQALQINELSELKLWHPQYTRLYFGNEFCNWRIPPLGEFEKIVEFVHAKNIALTMVTSYCNDSEIFQYRQIIEHIIQGCPEPEIIINDWGMYRVCRDLPLKMALGRLLVKQKRDPRIAEFIGTFPAQARKRVRDIGLNKSLLNFLRQENIKRIELDNVSQGLDLTDINNGFNFSLHIPFVYITLSRYCKFNMKRPGEGLRFSSCINKRCATIEIFNKNIKSPIFMRGNALFYKNYSLPEDIKHSRIDRIVYAGDTHNNQH